VRGEVHHDRRLHQLMLAEEVKAWDRRAAASGDEGAASAIAVLSDFPERAASAANPTADGEEPCFSGRACAAPGEPGRPAADPPTDPNEQPCFSGRDCPAPAPGGAGRRAAATSNAAAAAVPQASPADSASSLHGGLLGVGDDANALYRCALHTVSATLSHKQQRDMLARP